MTTPDTIARLTAEPAWEDVERVVERVARAICVENEQDPDGPHPEDAADGRRDGFPMWIFYTGSARPAIASLPDYKPLLTALAKVMPIRVNDGPDYAEAYFADGKTHSTQAMTMNPRDWRDLDEAYAMLAAAPTHPTDPLADAGKPIADDLRRTREVEAVELLSAIVDHYEDRQNAPGHGHSVVGIWDPDNTPDLAGKPCEWCAVWTRARIFLSTVSKEPEHG